MDDESIEDDRLRLTFTCWHPAFAPDARVALIEAILRGSYLADYQLAHAARADLRRRLGRTTEARASYERAIALARQQSEPRFLEGRLRELKWDSLSISGIPERLSSGRTVSQTVGRHENAIHDDDSAGLPA